jgi:hypothetical protein
MSTAGRVRDGSRELEVRCQQRDGKHYDREHSSDVVEPDHPRAADVAVTEVVRALYIQA